MSYSIDLRERSLSAVDSGLSKWKVHKTFKINRTTLYDWLKLRETTGSLKNINYCHGPKPTIDASEQTHQFFEEHKHKPLAQLCDLWFESRGHHLSDVEISKTLERLGSTRKKRAIDTMNEMS